MLNITSYDLAKSFDLQIFGVDIQLESISPISNLSEKSLSFFSNANKFSLSDNIPHSCCFITNLPELELSKFIALRHDLCFLVCDNPRLIFAKILGIFILSLWTSSVCA